MKSLSRILLTLMIIFSMAMPSTAQTGPMFRYKAEYAQNSSGDDTQNGQESEETEIPDAEVIPGVEPTVTIVASEDTIITTVGQPFELGYLISNANAVSTVGSFPSGMVIDVNDRKLVGTPTVTGTYTFNLRAYARVDGEVLTSNSNVVTVNVFEPFEIITSGTAEVLIGESFSVTLSSSQPGVTYFATSAIPEWMTLENGVLSGASAVEGVYNIGIRGQSLGLETSQTTITIAVVSLPDLTYEEGMAVVGQNFRLSPDTVGGLLNVTQNGGTLPDGLTMSPYGVITGSPTETGVFNYNVNAGRLGEYDDYGPFTINVVPGLSISGPEINDVYGGGEISVAVQPSASGGYEPYTWSSTGFPGTVDIDPATGVLSGDQGNSPRPVSGTVTVQDATGAINNKTITYEIFSPSVVVNGTRDAMVGEDYTKLNGLPVGAKAVSGVAPYSWSLTGHPSWLSIDPAAGTLSGTPSAEGDVEFDVVAEDANGVIASTTVAFAVLPELVVNAPELGQTDIGSPLNVVSQPSASGGDGDYTWTPGSNRISWININNDTGILSGNREDVPGDTMTLIVRDGAGYEAEATVSIDFASGLSITAPSFETAYINEPVVVVEQPTVSGGQSPYVWSMEDGAPNHLGVSIDPSTGELTVPMSADPIVQAFTIRATDDNGFNQRLTATIPFSDHLSMTAPVLDLGMVNRQLTTDQPAEAEGGVRPLVWSSPDAPEWMTVNTGSGGVSGTPTSEFDGGFTLVVTDAEGETVSEWVPLRVIPELVAQAPEFADAIQYQSVSLETQPSAYGGEEPYTWEITKGPAWLSIDADGLITGTASTTSSGNVVVKVTEANGFSHEVSGSLTVIEALSIIPPIITAQSVGYDLAVTRPVNARGGIGAYSWFIDDRPVWMTFDPQTGEMEGVPSQEGAFPFTITVMDEGGSTDSTTVVVTVGVTDLEISEPVFGTTITGLFVDVTQQPNATGGVPPYEFRLAGQPAWLDIDPVSGEIGGVAGEERPYSFSVGVVDNTGVEAWGTATIVVGPTVSVSSFPEVAPYQVVGSDIEVTSPASVEGGDGSYSWGLSGNPAWLAIAAGTGQLSGTVGDTGDSTVTVSVQDSGGDSQSGDFSFTTVNPLAISPPEASYLVRNEPIVLENQPVVAGGLLPYVWTLENEPAWLQIDRSSGSLSGTPDSDGNYEFQIVVNDGSDQSASENVSWEIFQLGITLPVVVATVGEQLNVTSGLGASGGDGFYTWSTSGAPAWLSLSSNGVMSGVPSAPGTVTFTASVMDGSGTVVGETVEFEVLSPVEMTPPVVTLVQEQADSLSVVSQATAVGGTENYQWSVIGAPSSIIIDADTGVLSGSLDQPFDGTFTVSVVDGDGRTDSAEVDLVVVETLLASGLTLNTVQTRTEQVAVTTQVNVSGGVSPYSWEVTEGPSWVEIDSATGEISGEIDVSEPFSITLRVTDNDGRTSEVTTGSTSRDPLVLSAQEFGDSVVDESLIINNQPSASGGLAPYTWTLVSDASFLNIDEATGQLTGSTNVGQEGGYDSRVVVTDAEGRSADADVSFNVYDIMALTQGVASVAYENVVLSFDSQPSITGGKAPFTWSTNGAPAWLSINSGTGELSGTPTAQGTFLFDIEVIDDAGRFAAVLMTLEVAPEPSSYDDFSEIQALSVAPDDILTTGQQTLALSNDGSVLVTGSYESNNSYFHIFERSGGSFSEVGRFTAPDEGEKTYAGRFFAHRVAISGDGSTIAVTRPYYSSQRGAVFIYEKIAGSWTHVQTWDEGVQAYASYDQFGLQVALDYDGDVLAVGSARRNAGRLNAGGVFIFEKNAGSFELQHVASSPSNYEGAYFGSFFGLDIDDSGSLIAAYYSGSSSSAKYGAIGAIYKTGGSWSNGNGVFFGTNGNIGGRGWAVSSDGLKIAVFSSYAPAASGAGESGSIRIIERDSLTDYTWVNGDHFTSDNAFISDQFGYSVDFGENDEEIVVGAYADDDNGNASGAAFVFQEDQDGEWVQRQVLTPNGAAANDYFGRRVAASGDGSTLVIDSDNRNELHLFTR